jgi:hypothetical protein
MRLFTIREAVEAVRKFIPEKRGDDLSKNLQ